MPVLSTATWPSISCSMVPIWRVHCFTPAGSNFVTNRSKPPFAGDAAVERAVGPAADQEVARAVDGDVAAAVVIVAAPLAGPLLRAVRADGPGQEHVAEAEPGVAVEAARRSRRRRRRCRPRRPRTPPA